MTTLKISSKFSALQAFEFLRSIDFHANVAGREFSLTRAKDATKELIFHKSIWHTLSIMVLLAIAISALTVTTLTTSGTGVSAEEYDENGIPFFNERKISKMQLLENYEKPQERSHECYKCTANCDQLLMELCYAAFQKRAQLNEECQKVINCCRPNVNTPTETCTGLCETEIELKRGSNRDITRHCSSRSWGANIGLVVTGMDNVFTKNFGMGDDPATLICRCRGENCNNIYDPHDCETGGYSFYVKIMMFLIVVLICFTIIAEIQFRVGIVIAKATKQAKLKAFDTSKKAMSSMSSSTRKNKKFPSGSQMKGNGNNGQFGTGPTGFNHTKVSPDVLDGRQEKIKSTG